MNNSNGLNVLSLFDGMACGRLALQRAGLPVHSYRAYEIDKWAMQVAQHNWPANVQVGDVTNWREWATVSSADDIPDMILAGSPCQGLSIAGRRLGLEDHRSRLFWTFVDILNWYQYWNPNIKFLLENVRMKAVDRDIISDALGVEPVLLNSALVSAQNRQRYYWANWQIDAPKDRGILLRDIIENGKVDQNKSYCIDANYFKGGSSAYLERQNHTKSRRQAVRVQSVRRLMIQASEADDIKGHGYNRRVYSPDGKGPTLATRSGGNLEPKIATDDQHWRKLTVLECERLQTVPEGYTAGVSNTQRYKMLGNGWTVEIIAHILRQMPRA